ncbi:MAG: hypothetical protein C0392_04815 [Syntrophus sp. (in: bacteria)]|nr:hypothetical protein [Syntrophus sp. (in: bacteria)]
MRPIYTIPFGADFIHELSTFIISDHRPLKDIAVVFPGKRPALYLKRTLAERLNTPFYAPAFFSMETFIDYMVRNAYPAFSDLEYNDAIWLLYEAMGTINVFRHHPLREKGFARFYYWGQYLYGFIDHLDRENISGSTLLSFERNAALGYDVPGSVNELLANISLLRERFHEMLEKERFFTGGYKYLRALSILDQSDFSEFDHIYFAGFFGLTGIEKTIMQHLWQQGKAALIIEGEIHEWPILRQLIADFGGLIVPIPCEKQAPGCIKLYSGFDTHSEALKVFTILDEKEPQKTALVLPLSEALFPVLTFAVDRIDAPYNISLGYPLLRTPVFDLISNVLNAQMTRRNQRIYPAKAYLQVMLHPFVKNLTLDKDLRVILLFLERLLTGEERGSTIANKVFITLDEMEQAVKLHIRKRQGGDTMAAGQKALHDIHAIFFSAFEESGTLDQYGEKLEMMLNFILHNTPVRSYILSGEIFKQAFETLERIRGTRFSKERFDADEAENRRIMGDFLLQFLKSTTLPFDTTPVEPLEIIGVLESRNIRFDRVIMLDVNEGVMPRPKQVDPLVPLGIYEKLGIPSPEQNEEIYRYYFYRLIRSAKDVHLLYVDGDDRPRSRYIEQIIWEMEKEKGELDVITVDRSSYKIRLAPRERLPEIRKTDAVLQLLAQRRYSPSEIDEFIRCPVSFYFSRILNFEEKKEVNEDIDAMDRGIIIHRILFSTFEPFKGSEITPALHGPILLSMTEALEREFRHRIITGEYYLFKKLTAFKLESFLKRHIAEAEKPFIIKHLEQSLEHTFPIDNLVIKFRGRVDRIDFYPEENEYQIVDYKTGGTKAYQQRTFSRTNFSSMEDIHRHISTFQLPIYVSLFQQTLDAPDERVNAKLLLLKNNQEEVLLKTSSSEEREAIQAQYMEGVRTVLRNILDPKKPFSPFDDGNCPDCPFNLLCHV